MAWPAEATGRTRQRRRAVALRVRAASSADVDTIAHLRVALLLEEGANPLFAEPHPRALARARDLTRRQLSRSHETFLLATRGTSVVGLLRVRDASRSALVRDGRYAAITTAYVVPAERRRGVMRALLRAADGWCSRRGIDTLQLRCGARNREAQHAWRALGFTTVAVLMTRRRQPA